MKCLGLSVTYNKFHKPPYSMALHIVCKCGNLLVFQAPVLQKGVSLQCAKCEVTYTMELPSIVESKK